MQPVLIELSELRDWMRASGATRVRVAEYEIELGPPPPPEPPTPPPDATPEDRARRLAASERERIEILMGREISDHEFDVYADPSNLR